MRNRLDDEVESFSHKMANAAVQSLIEEVELTPKPGLVDKKNSGSHSDLTFQLMKKSSKSLMNTFKEIAIISYGRSPGQLLREEVAAIGRDGEKRMFEVTGGVNTHKGAIWSLGLLISAVSMGKGMYTLEEAAKKSGELARYSDRHVPLNRVTNGDGVREKYGTSGARGEAQQGFPHILSYSMPALILSRKNGCSENEARLQALLSLISHLNDTCILHRGGLEALTFAKTRAVSWLKDGRLDSLNKLDDEFIRRNISPGGSADLLAATLFLDKISPVKQANELQKEYESIN